VIAYVDSSVLSRAYLRDEQGHEDAVDILTNLDIALVTGSWTRVEVSEAIVRAARAGRGDEATLLAMLDADTGEGGPVTVLAPDQTHVEREAMDLVRRHGTKAMDSWHLATALLTLPGLADRGEQLAFASRDKEQAAVAQELGFQLI